MASEVGLHNIDVEQIVREVLARLHANDHRVETNASPSATQPSTSKPDYLEIPERLVTLATLEHRLDGIRNVVLRRGAVVTPSAWDLLRAAGVHVSSAVAQAAALPSLVVGVAGMSAAGRHQVSQVIAWLREKKIHVEQLAETGFLQVITEACDLVTRGGRLALVFASQPTVAACLANRSSGVRAAGGSQCDVVHRAMQEIGANLLVVDPTTPAQALYRLIADFCEGWPRPVPAALAT